MGLDSISLRSPAMAKAPTPQVLEASQSTPPAAGMRRDQLVLQPTSLDLPGLKTGQKYETSGIAEGYDFSGYAVINGFDGKKLEATLDVSVFFFSAKLRLMLDEQEDGSFKYALDRISGSSQFPEHRGASLKVVSARPGLTILEDQEGCQMKLEARKGGELRITYGTSVTKFRP